MLVHKGKRRLRIIANGCAVIVSALTALLGTSTATVCPACLAHDCASVPHPRSGTPDAGEFVGNLVEMVTRDVRR